MVCMFVKLCGYICSNKYYTCMCSCILISYKSCKLVENSARIQASYFLGCMVQNTPTESRTSCILPEQCKNDYCLCPAAFKFSNIPCNIAT